MTFFIPPDLARFTIAGSGTEGKAWLRRLPQLVSRFAERWQITIHRAFEPGGVVGFVAPATLADGTPAVFKLSIPDRETRHEGAALRLYDGQGAVQLLAADEEQGALLLERCLPGTPLWDLPDEVEAYAIAAGVLKRLWRTVPAVHPFDLATDRAAEWAGTVRREFVDLGTPFEPGLADAAARLFEDLAAAADKQVLLHQDFHTGNILAAQREPWLAIDPKPLVGERVFDAATLLWDRTSALLADPQPGRRMERRLDQLCEALDLDRTRVRDWALARAVELGLWSVSVNDREGGLQQLACARLLAAL